MDQTLYLGGIRTDDRMADAPEPEGAQEKPVRSRRSDGTPRLCDFQHLHEPPLTDPAAHC
jgi:hypothetical protein